MMTKPLVAGVAFAPRADTCVPACTAIYASLIITIPASHSIDAIGPIYACLNTFIAISAHSKPSPGHHNLFILSLPVTLGLGLGWQLSGLHQRSIILA